MSIDRYRWLRLALRRRDEVSDAAFDELYSGRTREVSSWYWTPVSVAQRAAELFERRGVKRVLDVGSGAGKFCIVAASTCPDMTFLGLEQRPHLVAIAREAAAALELDNVRFVVGDATDNAWTDVDGVYLYNPFGENIYGDSERLDGSVELSLQRYDAEVHRTLQALSTAPKGLAVVTYNGFGGPVPASFELAHAEQDGLQWLRLWVKTHEDDGPPEAFYLERDDGVLLVHRPDPSRWAGVMIPETPETPETPDAPEAPPDTLD